MTRKEELEKELQSSINKEIKLQEKIGEMRKELREISIKESLEPIKDLLKEGSYFVRVFPRQYHGAIFRVTKITKPLEGYYFRATDYEFREDDGDQSSRVFGNIKINASGGYDILKTYTQISEKQFKQDFLPHLLEPGNLVYEELNAKYAVWEGDE